MPQGSRLGPLSSIVLIDDLRAACELHKFVDDTTLSELIPSTGSASNMPSYFTSVLTWTANNDMQINTSKTKEMIIGSLDSINVSPLSTSLGTVERVATFKLLGIHLDINLSWSVHINSITSKASKRLYFLKQLKRAGVPQNQLLHFYTAVIRPVLEYAAPVWHHLINRTQAQQLESIQKRAIHIIYNITRGMSYPNVLFVAELESLETRRNNQSRSFFQDICKPTSCLYHLIPPPRDTSVITRLRPTTLLPKPSLRTKKYCSFINFGLHHYQPKK